jgi:flagellar basal body-associated protein FliL
MYGIDYYPHRRKAKRKSTLLIIIMLIFVSLVAYWVLTTEKATKKDMPELIIISEPQQISTNLSTDVAKSVTISPQQQPIYEIEQLDELLLSQDN